MKLKPNGMIIDYFGVFRNLKQALVTMLRVQAGQVLLWICLLKSLMRLLKFIEEAIDKAKGFLKTIGVDVNRIHDLGEKALVKLCSLKSCQ